MRTKEEVLGELIISVYKGSITQKNALDVMNYVSQDSELQSAINSSDWERVRKMAKDGALK